MHGATRDIPADCLLPPILPPASKAQQRRHSTITAKRPDRLHDQHEQEQDQHAPQQDQQQRHERARNTSNDVFARMHARPVPSLLHTALPELERASMSRPGGCSISLTGAKGGVLDRVLRAMQPPPAQPEGTQAELRNSALSRRVVARRWGSVARCSVPGSAPVQHAGSSYRVGRADPCCKMRKGRSLHPYWLFDSPVAGSEGLAAATAIREALDEPEGRLRCTRPSPTTTSRAVVPRSARPTPQPCPRESLPSPAPPFLQTCGSTDVKPQALRARLSRAPKQHHDSSHDSTRRGHAPPVAPSDAAYSFDLALQPVPTPSSSLNPSSLPIQLATSPTLAFLPRSGRSRLASWLVTLRHPSAEPSFLLGLQFQSSRLVRLHFDSVLEQPCRRGSNKPASPLFSTCSKAGALRGPRPASRQAIVKISRVKQAPCRTLRYRRRGWPQAEKRGQNAVQPPPQPVFPLPPAVTTSLQVAGVTPYRVCPVSEPQLSCDPGCCHRPAVCLQPDVSRKRGIASSKTWPAGVPTATNRSIRLHLLPVKTLRALRNQVCCNRSGASRQHEGKLGFHPSRPLSPKPDEKHHLRIFFAPHDLSTPPQKISLHPRLATCQDGLLLPRAEEH
ncbi:hypothetical protein B0J12DRAFT_696793 [Macrophomina phaseolina]|uniref:Uncharacterized protein n=1 Tax=Macrophomina phaseolina TaxID=35725 RepID=A0ABQ8GHZ0_9PEZI|nr:hypothetical protein B0J12DRAFT_696793 [Macrophomina phaseolina]